MSDEQNIAETASSSQIERQKMLEQNWINFKGYSRNLKVKQVIYRPERGRLTQNSKSLIGKSRSYTIDLFSNGTAHHVVDHTVTDRCGSKESPFCRLSIALRSVSHTVGEKI